MPNYLLAYHGGTMPQTEAEQKKVMNAWMEWMGSLGKKLIDPGNPIGATKTVSSDGKSKTGGDNPATGYSVISAGNMAAAVRLAKGCPHLAAGGTVEIGETFPVM